MALRLLTMQGLTLAEGGDTEQGGGREGRQRAGGLLVHVQSLVD